MRAFLFYIDDWLSSKKIGLMDAHEERGYLRFLMRAATEPDCGLPDDDAQLAILSLLRGQWFKPTKEKHFRLGDKTSGQKLRECFFEKDGRLFNERLLKEWEYQREISEKRTKASAAGNLKRWGKVKEIPNELPTASHLGSQTESQTDPNDVCVYSFSSSQQKEIPLEAPASKKNGLMDPHPIHNADWFEFRVLAESVGMSGSEPDWSDAFRWYWRRMSVEARVAARKGLQDRAGTDDPAIRSLPQNYLKQEKWDRKVREPATVSERDAKVMEILERKARERSERGSQQSV